MGSLDSMEYNMTQAQIIILAEILIELDCGSIDSKQLGEYRLTKDNR